MTEEEYIGAIKSIGSTQGDTSIEKLKLADKAIAVYPHSAKLWCLRGQIIQVAPASCPYTLTDALNSLLKAIEEDNEYSEGHEEIGHFYDTVEDNPALAEPYFRQAIALGGSLRAYVGLARVLAELGRIRDIRPLLEDSPYCDSPEVSEVLVEIEEGIRHR